ncbi:MAG: tyrosine-type recombinase/integrase [Dinghuibacter sp.]|nr:tyrosine-type recombinase/integrase [Dinghuibacter sp.]
MQHINGFVNYLKFEKRYSALTLRAYTDDLAQFNTYLLEQYGATTDGEIRAIYIRSWLAEMKDAGISAKSLNRKISSLRSYFRFLMKKGVVSASPLTQVSAPKTGKRLPVFVEQRDMDTLLNDVPFPEGQEGAMQHLVLQMFYHTGMRLSELIGIKISDINYSRLTIRILGKGNKAREVPLTPALAASVQQYIQAYPAPATGHLFTTEKGQPLYAGYVYRLVKKYLSGVTTIKKKSPHVLRHSFATHLSNNGAELNAIKELLGHASLAATQVYTHNSIEKLKEIHARAHPKS